jgi:hypothetical protein
MSGENQRIIIGREGKEFGPYTRDEATLYLKTGQLLHSDIARRFEFHKRSQLFIGTHDEPCSLAVRVNDPDRSPIMVERSRLAEALC